MMMDSATGESSTSTQQCVRFSLKEIQSATNNFDDGLIIGHGGFGKVYKGCLYTNEVSPVVAVKRMDCMSNQGAPEFRAEIEMLSKLRHRHLVSLIGFCDDNQEMILVYQYMPHGTLYDHLHKALTPLSWVQRVKIAIGAARGLDYLHTGTLHGIMHRDVKSSNILLDENWAAMISDFGLSKIGPANQSIPYVDASVKGTFGYLDPEYFYTGKLTMKTDVFAFGVVLFELLSGRLAVEERNGDEHSSLVKWAKKCVKERKIDHLVDSNIKGTIFPKCLRQFSHIANQCVHNVPEERPTMTKVVASLQSILDLQEKSNHYSKSSGIMGLTSKIHNYFRSASKPNPDQSGTRSPKSLDNNMNKDEELVISDVKLFTYDELKLATRNFRYDTCMGEWTYGKCYKGWVNETTYSSCKGNTALLVVVKKLHHYTFGYSMNHFRGKRPVSKVDQYDMPSKLEILKEFQHPNLVKFIGCCLESGYIFLVYEFMLKGNLDDLLCSRSVARLPLATRVKIVVGIARGIVFLQKKKLNKTWPNFHDSMLDRRKILLDEHFTAKLSDYDVAFLVNGQYDLASRECDGLELVLNIDLSGYEVVFLEVLTGERIYYLNEVLKIDRLFHEYGKESLRHIAQLCFEMCNEVDVESKMLRMLKEHDKLIRRRLKSWLSDPHN